MSTNPGVKTILLTALAALTALIAGYGCNRVRYSRAQEARYYKPTITVLDFDNQVRSAKWPVGSSFADKLSDRLLATRRYVILERAHYQSLRNEYFRNRGDRYKEARERIVQKLGEVRYVIKGSITDFGPYTSHEGLRKIIGPKDYSLVAATVKILDNHTGQIIDIRTFEEKVAIKDHEKPPKDPKKPKKPQQFVSFQGYAFARTSLGQATNKVLDKAVRFIANTLEERGFQPKISSVINNQVVINGGRNRNIRISQVFIVRPPSKIVLDPDTEHTLGHIAGSEIGKVQVVQVTDKFAIAKIIEGNQFQTGQTLFPAVHENLGWKNAIANN